MIIDMNKHPKAANNSNDISQVLMKIWCHYLLALPVSLLTSFIFHLDFVVASHTSNCNAHLVPMLKWIGLLIQAPRQVFFLKLKLFKQLDITFLYIQIKNSVAKLQRSWNSFCPLVDVKKIEFCLYKLYLMLLSNIMVKDRTKAQWECDLQDVIVKKTQGNISQFGPHSDIKYQYSRNVLKIRHRWYMTPPQLSKWLPNRPDTCWRYNKSGASFVSSLEELL